MNSNFQLDLSKRFPTLPYAPIVEAVLQWQAAATVEWDETTLRDKLTASFPQYEITPQHNIGIALTGSAKGLELKHSTTWEGFRLANKEEGKPAFVCQFKQNGLVVSDLAPYKKWEEFEPEALRFWQTFVEMAEPDEIAGLSTRFIPQIPVDSVSAVGDYVDVARNRCWRLAFQQIVFSIRITLELAGLPYNVELVRAVQPRQEGPQPLTIQQVASRCFDEAEGMGLEPTTPCGAPDFESDATCQKTREKTPVSDSCQQIASSDDENDADLALIFSAWPELPDAVKAGILAMVKSTSRQ